MRGPALLFGVAALAAAITTVNPPAAKASEDSWGLDGTYTATSNGDLARTNEVFRPEASIRSTWTITTECSYPTECNGTVSSDWGWTAPLYKKSGVWYVKRTVENWVPCPDGTAAPGLQIYRFVPVVDSGTRVDPTSTTLAGEDRTAGPSGACGINKPVFISIPFKLVKNT